MNAPYLSISRRTRKTPFTQRVTQNGVSAYTVYNHMLLPTAFESVAADYWHLCEHVQVWDVAAQRQVAIQGPDAAQLVQLMTPRNISKAKIGQCFYLPLCDEKGKLLNDPVGLKLNEDHWWLSLADSDILLWAKGLATGYGFDVDIQEPDVSPLAIQGPKAEDLAAKVLGEEVTAIGFFKFKHLSFKGHSMVVARSGWSKQGGFEIYVDDRSIALELWDELFRQGESMNLRAGCPNAIERVESCLLSFGNDMDSNDTPFDCGLDRYISLKEGINSLSIAALRRYAIAPQKKLIGLVLEQAVGALNPDITINGKVIAEIRSQCWSPRYQRTLALAMCQRSSINGLTHLALTAADQTLTAQMRAQVCDLPFDFKALGLTPA